MTLPPQTNERDREKIRGDSYRFADIFNVEITDAWTRRTLNSVTGLASADPTFARSISFFVDNRTSIW
jgi:hypothetical protein